MHALVLSLGLLESGYSRPARGVVRTHIAELGRVDGALPLPLLLGRFRKLGAGSEGRPEGTGLEDWVGATLKGAWQVVRWIGGK